ncbi:hypothetical protein ES708_25991 [subsurface metagenome]
MGERKEYAGNPKPETENQGRIEKMGFENEWTREVEKLRIENGELKQCTVRDNNTITTLTRIVKTKDELIASLRVDRETLLKANLLLENNLRILHLSVDP